MNLRAVLRCVNSIILEEIVNQNDRPNAATRFNLNCIYPPARVFAATRSSSKASDRDISSHRGRDRRRENQSGMERGAGPETRFAPVADFAPTLAGGPGFGPIVIDPATGAVVWSQPARALFGLDPLAPADVERLFERVDPEDRPAVEQEFARCAASGDDLDVAFRVRRNGQPHWLRLLAASAGAGASRRLSGGVLDIDFADARRGGAAQPRGASAIDPRDRPRRDDRHRRGRDHSALQPRRRAACSASPRTRRSARTCAS